MTILDLPRPVELTSTPESLRLARINADLASIEAKQLNPHGWGRLLEDERSRLLSERAVLLAGRVALTATTMLGA